MSKLGPREDNFIIYFECNIKFKIYQLELFQYQLVSHPAQDYFDNKVHGLI